ncbi:hypothetical protein BX666DRAFT_1911498 [Dichotomocladium elegans]|nr:hypothetical protein BX666DRAFT_1911498 [Dichotomocladium elegans]
MIHHDHQLFLTAMSSQFHPELNIPASKNSCSDYQQNCWSVLEPIPRLSVSTLSDDSTERQSSLPSSSSSSSSSSSDDDTSPSRRELFFGHIRSLSVATVRFLLKNNNWALVVNLVHHLWGARKFIYSQAPKWRGSVAHDVARVAGAMHFAFATLTGLALKKKRLSTDRSTLLVLLLVAIGQTYAYATSFWKSGAAWTVDAVRQSGLLDSLVFVVSSLAYSKTLRRSGRLI